MTESAETPTLTISDTPENESETAQDLIKSCQRYLNSKKNGISKVSFYETSEEKPKKKIRVGYTATIVNDRSFIKSLIIATNPSDENLSSLRKMVGLDEWPQGRQIQLSITSFSGSFPNVKSTYALKDYGGKELDLAKEVLGI